MLEELGRRCAGKNGWCSYSPHRHDLCSGRVAKPATIYPLKVCEAILKGPKRHVDKQGRTKEGLNLVFSREGLFENFVCTDQGRCLEHRSPPF